MKDSRSDTQGEILTQFTPVMFQRSEATTAPDVDLKHEN